MRLAAPRRSATRRLIELTCNPALPNFTLTKLLWVQEHEPELFAQIRAHHVPQGLRALPAHRASSPSTCRRLPGTLLLDVTHRRWSKEVAEAAGIPAELAADGVRIARDLRAHQRQRGGTDRAGSRHAGRCRRGRPGRRCGGHGHSAARIRRQPPSALRAWCSPPLPSRRKDPKGRLHTFCHAVPGLWHVMGVTQSAGLSLQLAAETFFAAQSYDSLTEAAPNAGGERRAGVGAVSPRRAHAASRS